MKCTLLLAVAVCIVLTGCGGQATPDPTEVAQAVEATLTARARVPTLERPGPSPPIETPIPPSADTPTPLDTSTYATATPPADSPEIAAMEWLEAQLNLRGVTLAERTCASQRDDVQGDATLVSALALLVGQDVQGSISGVQFETLSIDGDTAQVKVSGETRVAVLGSSTTSVLDETWQMVREDGVWKWCGQAGACVPHDPGTHGLDLGWMGIPVEVRIASTGDGWAELEASLVLRNDTGAWSRMWAYSTTGGWRPSGQAWVTTAEGYAYDCRFRLVSSTLPPGFQGGVDENWISCQVAEETSGHRLHVRYEYSVGFVSKEGCERTGQFEVDLVETDVSFPIGYEAIDMHAIGELIYLGGGKLYVTEVTRREDRLYVSWTYMNSSDGYGAALEVEVDLWVDNGGFYGRSRHGSSQNVGGEILVGPGQVETFEAVFEGIPLDARATHLVVAVSEIDFLWDTAYVIDLEGQAMAAVELTGMGSMLFTTDRGDYNDEVYVMNADGSDRRNLTNHPSDDGTACWSPDGQLIVFTSNRDGNDEVYVMNADGSNPKNLTNNPSSDDDPRWSPDGRLIAFTTDRDGNPEVYNSEVYVMNADGSNPRNLSQRDGPDADPVWSPDGQWIAYYSLRDETAEINVMNADGSEKRNLTRVPNAPADYGWLFPQQWSPDGSMILITSMRDGGGWNIYVIDADGSNLRRVTNHPFTDVSPRWSPDGQLIAFSSNRYGSYDIFAQDLLGTKVVRITSATPTDEYVSCWLP